jgi:branched-subunit amino acid aminotransferase/4-amino-4-deoxychorismate lyase
MSMDDRDGVIWLDGKLCPWRDAKVHVLTHTLHYGMGVFEGIRAYQTERGTAIFRLNEHMERLYNSAHIMRIPLPYGKADISRACLEVLRGNKLASAYWPRRAGKGNTRQDLFAYAPPCQYRHVQGQGQWPLYKLDAGLSGSARARL